MPYDSTLAIIVSAVTLAIYVPVFFFTFRISSRYGVKERGWLLLVIFSLIRIVTNALLVAREQLTEVAGLGIGFDVLDASGLSPLLLSTLELLEIITTGPDSENIYALAFRNFLHVVGIVALVLVAVGLSDFSSGNRNTECRVGVLLFAGLYICLIAVIVMKWANRYELMRHRKQLLIAVSAALPFLAVRTLYSVLSTFSYDPNNPRDKLYMFFRGWKTHVVMDVIMEYAVVVIYILAGTMLPLDQDYKLQETDEHPLHHCKY